MITNRIDEARRVFDIEIENLIKVRNSLGEEFLKLTDIILNCQGKCVFIGMGKSGHIANKIAATMSSLGIPSFYVHPAEAAHGDLGMIDRRDVIIAISYSGETSEIIQLIPSIKEIGTVLVSIVGNSMSTLGKYSDLEIVLEISQEACMHNLAPTTSTTSVLVFGDALAVVLSQLVGFRKENFALYHPKGSLGKKLLTKVEHVMHGESLNPIVTENDCMKSAINEISKKGLGAVNIVDENNTLIGIITDGDLRRGLEKFTNILDMNVKDIMTINPITICKDKLAIEALKLMEQRERQIMVLPVVDENRKPIGLIRVHDIVKEGIKL